MFVYRGDNGCWEFFTSNRNAKPIYAQQAYANPREANGRIARANCHLSQLNLQQHFRFMHNKHTLIRVKRMVVLLVQTVT
jgi:hypothetical protein